MDWPTALVLWTPISVALLALFCLAVFVVAGLTHAFRSQICAWFAARWVEQSSAHARTIAITTTAAYVGSRLGIPSVDPVSLTLVTTGWAWALWQFIKPDMSPNPPPAGPSK